ncbi:hypothetical protein AB0L06_36655 [Spirillospora sp. NPDC052269]
MTERSLIGRNSPISDEDAGGLVSDAAFEDLAADIARAAEAVQEPDTREPVLRKPPVRRRRRFALAFGAVAAGAAVVAVVIGWPGGQPSAEALSISRDGRYIDIAVRDPKADTARLQAELDAHHMPVKLKALPASPSLVGSMVNVESEGSKAEQAELGEIPKAKCGEVWCRTGVRVPVGLKTPVTVLFGRAPNPGERIELTGSATASGEILAGVPLRGRTVAEVVTALRQRHGKVETYNLDRPAGRKNGGYDVDEHVVPENKVKGSWYVSFAFSGHTPGAVQLLVSEQNTGP